MSSGYDRRRVFAAACLGMSIFGVVLTVLGSVLPPLMERFGLARTAAGALLSLMSLGILVGSLVFGPIVDRHGYRTLLVLCACLVALGLEGIAFTPSLLALRASVFAIGFGGGVINGGTNALVADVSEGERGAGLSLLGMFFGIGALAVPALLGLSLGSFSYTSVIGAIGAVAAFPLPFFAATRFPPPKHAQGFPMRAGLGLLRERSLLVLGSLLFLQSGMEITVGGWTAAYMKEELAVPQGRAIFLLSLYWMGLTLARLGLGFALRRIPAPRVLYVSMGIALAGTLALLGSRGVAGAAGGIVLIGVGFAAAFPVVLGYVGDLYASLSGTAFSIALVMALGGGMLLPYATGALGDAFGLRSSLAIVPVSLCVQAAVFRAVAARLPAPDRLA